MSNENKQVEAEEISPREIFLDKHLPGWRDKEQKDVAEHVQDSESN